MRKLQPKRQEWNASGWITNLSERGMVLLLFGFGVFFCAMGVLADLGAEQLSMVTLADFMKNLGSEALGVLFTFILLDRFKDEQQRQRDEQRRREDVYREEQRALAAEFREEQRRRDEEYREQQRIREDERRERERKQERLDQLLRQMGSRNPHQVEMAIDLLGTELITGGALRGGMFERAYWRGTDLKSANLEDARLSEANLRDVQLMGAKLSGADLNKVSATRANLMNADLTAALLINADFSDANFGGAILDQAVLQNTNLRRAKLGGASLRGANMVGAVLEGAQLPDSDAEAFNEDTTLPDGSRWTPDADLSHFTDPARPDFHDKQPPSVDDTHPDMPPAADEPAPVPGGVPEVAAAFVPPFLEGTDELLHSGDTAIHDRALLEGLDKNDTVTIQAIRPDVPSV